MIVLPLAVFTKPEPLLTSRSASFPSRICFYLKHRDDIEFAFPTLVVADFLKGEFNYFETFNAETSASVSALEWNPFRIGMPRSFDPHWTTELNDGSLLLFFQRRRYFYRFFPKSGCFHVCFPEDLGLPKETDEFWATNFRNPDGSIDFLTHESYGNRKTFSIRRANPAFDRFETLYVGHTRSGNIPHVIVPYRNGYLLSDFYYNDFYLKNDPKKTKVDEDSLLESVYSRLLKPYLASLWRRADFTEKEFREFVRTGAKGVVPILGFADYLNDLYAKANVRSVKEYCDLWIFQFLPFPGEITFVVPNEKEERSFETSGSNPAHFEIDPLSWDLYVSSHNFNYLNRNFLEYFAPAIIDRFVWNDGSFEKAESFSDSEGFRFTSHRLAEFKGKKGIVTFGQPNRILFFSVPSMLKTVEEDVSTWAVPIPKGVDENALMRYLKREWDEEGVSVKGFEVSKDGSWLVFALDGTCAHLFSLEERRIVASFGVVASSDPDLAEGFTCRTTHCSEI